MDKSQRQLVEDVLDALRVHMRVVDKEVMRQGNKDSDLKDACEGMDISISKLESALKENPRRKAMEDRLMRLQRPAKGDGHSKPKKLDLSCHGPYATSPSDDRATARELGITVRQLRQDRAGDDRAIQYPGRCYRRKGSGQK